MKDTVEMYIWADVSRRISRFNTPVAIVAMHARTASRRADSFRTGLKTKSLHVYMKAGTRDSEERALVSAGADLDSMVIPVCGKEKRS